MSTQFKNKFYAVFAACVFFGIGLLAPAHAQSNYYSEGNKTIAKLGAQGTIFYVYFVESTVNQTCLNGIQYIAAEKKGLYTQLLAAKLTGKHISRVDYSQPGGSGTMCNLELVEIAE